MSAPSPSPTLISSFSDLRVFLSSIQPSSTIYLDLEGQNLSRNGTLLLLIVLVYPAQVTKIIDVQELGMLTFYTCGWTNRKTLKDILEDPDISKCLWDVRNDADILYAHYNVRLGGVTDVQLLDNASRADDKTYLRGFDLCVEKDLKLPFMDRHRFAKTKREVRALMPNNILAPRPLDDQTMQYCVNDVKYLPLLQDVYVKRIDKQRMKKAMDESAQRVVDSCGAAYDPQSEKKKLRPWGSGSAGNELTVDQFLEMWEDKRMDDMQRDLLGYDSYDDYNDEDRYDDDRFGMCSKDAAFDDTFDSCWEK
ncbi:Uu.00g046970.m01.CDS01 [Anthostomella pinea]|uniref:Uu.00g046970.m01.CDS01 n=1 Tax=Anthostomella pinea TaxID=933095 RepID=A0AAI8VBF8_9PEZI|nr:Uu.00g046970.m01.CDS01 [Anthostomella pinea]